MGTYMSPFEASTFAHEFNVYHMGRTCYIIVQLTILSKLLT
jgi:hypothetical protein